MYFEVSARTGSNITLTFNEIAKKLTGIDTNPIQRSEITSSNNAAFNLNQINIQGGNNANGGAGAGAGQKAKKKQCGC